MSDKDALSRILALHEKVSRAGERLALQHAETLTRLREVEAECDSLHKSLAAARKNIDRLELRSSQLADLKVAIMGEAHPTGWRMRKVLSRLAELKKERARRLVAEQAEDPALWFRAETAPEALLQEALRRLHAVVEGKGWPPPPNGSSPTAR